MKEIIDACHKHKIDVSKIDLNQSVDDIIDDIESDIIHKVIVIDNPRVVMSDFWKIKQSTKYSEIVEGSDFQDRMSKILKNPSFKLSENFIECVKFIPCSVVQTEYDTRLLNPQQKQRLIDLGYGISKYKIRNDETIRDVYCEGNHPNLNMNSHQFCLDVEFLNLPLNKDNVLLLEELLSHFNLQNCFIPIREKRKILEVCS